MTDTYTAALSVAESHRQRERDDELARMFGTLPPSPPRHHRNDPATSVEAGILVEGTAPHRRAVILRELAAAGPEGRTADEIEQRQGWEPMDAARRLSELWSERPCLVARGPDTRPTRRGRRALVWRGSGSVWPVTN